jgi:MYXO-CTERM domain-containing protein
VEPPDALDRWTCSSPVPAGPAGGGGPWVLLLVVAAAAVLVVQRTDVPRDTLP